MRIVFLIPFYSVMNIFAVLFLHHSEYFELAKSIYESIAIVAFHRLLLSYIAPDEESRNIYFERKEPVKNFGFGLVSNQHTFNAKAMFLVSQFVFVRTFLNIIAAILQSRDAYCPQGGPKFGAFWVKIISIISMVSALYGILCVYWVAHDDIASRKTTQKVLYAIHILNFLFVSNIIEFVVFDRETHHFCFSRSKLSLGGPTAKRENHGPGPVLSDPFYIRYRPSISN
jgi:hypothetical protein